jgi:hypothetical protein
MINSKSSVLPESQEKTPRDIDGKDILFEDLDLVIMNFKPYGVFFIWYIFNALFVLPCFILKATI